MHYLKGRHIWIIAVAVGLVLVAAAVASFIFQPDMAPLAPGPIVPTPANIGSM